MTTRAKEAGRAPASAHRRRCRRAGALATLAVAAGGFLSGTESIAQVPSFGVPSSLHPAMRRDSHADEHPRLAAGRGGVWVAAWQVSGASSSGLGRDTDVVWSRSADAGATWSEPAPVSERFRRDRAEDRQPAIVTDGAGNWVIAWTSTDDLIGQVKKDRDIHLSFSSDDARTWSEPKALNANAARDWGDDSAVDLAVDGLGRWVAVWQSTDSLGNTKGGDQDILFASTRDPAGDWSAPAVVDAAARSDAAFDTSPQVAAADDGAWVVAWSTGGALEDRPGFQRDILVARSDDGGGTWSEPRGLATSQGEDRPDFAPRLATDGGRHWVCAWASGDTLGDTIGMDRDILVSRSTDGGRTWSARVPLNVEAGVDSGDDAMPDLVADRVGNWVAAWTSWDKRSGAFGATPGAGADADVFVAMSRDAGASWTRPALLGARGVGDRGEDLEPALATDGRGLWMAAWSTNENDADPLGADRDLLVAVGAFGREMAGPPVPGSGEAAGEPLPAGTGEPSATP